MRHVWTNAQTAQHAPASGGKSGASRLDGPLGAQFSAQPDRPCGPPLSPRLRRGSPCGSIRARGARNVRAGQRGLWLAERGPAVGLSLSLGQAPPGRVRPKAKRRGEPVVGCGTPANEPALSTPSRGGQRSRPRAGAGMAIPAAHCGFGPAYVITGTNGTGHAWSEFFAAEHKSVLISNMPKSSRSLVRTGCRTRGGLDVFGCNSDMRRHGEL